MKTFVSLLAVLFLTTLTLGQSSRIGGEGGTPTTITGATWEGGLYAEGGNQFTQLDVTITVQGSPNTTYRVMAVYLRDCEVQTAWYVLGDANVTTDATGVASKYFYGRNPARQGDTSVLVPEFGWQGRALLFTTPGPLDTPLSQVDTWVPYEDRR